MTDRPTSAAAGLAEDLRNVVHEAEALLASIGDENDAALAELRARVFGALGTAKERLADLEDQANIASQRWALAAEEYVREHPWRAIAIGAAAGLLLGALVGRLTGRSRRAAPRAAQETAHAVPPEQAARPAEADRAAASRSATRAHDAAPAEAQLR